MDDLLFPPSAFTNRVSQRINFKSDDNELTFLSMHNDKVLQRVNESSQTEWIKTVTTGSFTTEQIFSAEDFEAKIVEKKAKYMKKVNFLKKQCSDEVSKVSIHSEDMSRKLSEVLREKDLLAEELSKLKCYISGIEDRDTWLKEKQRLAEEIDSLRYTISDQQSIMESLNIQISSMEKIQCIQERELRKDVHNICSNQLTQREPNYEVLLRAWRHKVLSLLVQQESLNIENNKENHRFREENQDLVNELKHLHSSLEQLNLRLDVQQAQLSTSEILVEKYKRDNDNLHWKLQTLSREQEVNNGQFEQICHQLNSFCKVIDEEVFVKFDSACSKIDTFHRRLDYANSRFPMIQANLKRQRNMTEDKGSGDRFLDDLSPGTFINKIHQLEEALVITNNELRILRQERDRLITTMEGDSATFFDRLNQKKEELKDEMEHLRETVSKYENSLSKVSKDLELAKQENYRLKGDYDSLLSSKHSEAESLHVALKESRAELSRLSLEYSELKRSASQAKKHMEEHIFAAEQNLTKCDNQWKKTCDQLSAERDLLKMTIRQEGILSKLKTRTQDRKPTRDKSLEKRDADNIMKEVNELAEELNINHERWN